MTTEDLTPPIGRLSEETLGRFIDHASALLELCELLGSVGEPSPVVRNVTQQMTVTATQPMSYVFEANDAIRREDFIRCMGVASQKLGAIRGWLMVLAVSGIMEEALAKKALAETLDLQRMVKSLIARARSRRKSR